MQLEVVNSVPVTEELRSLRERDKLGEGNTQEEALDTTVGRISFLPFA